MNIKRDKVDLKILKSFEEVNRYYDVWNRLVDKQPCIKPFSCPDWLREVCVSFNLTPVVFMAFSEGELLACLPLVKDASGELGFPRPDVGDGFDLILNSRDALELGEVILLGLRDLLGKEGLCTFLNLRKDSLIFRSLDRLLEDEEEIVFDVKIRMNSPFVDLRAGWDAYWKTRSRNFRRSFKRSEKKLSEFRLKYLTLSQDDSRHEEALVLILDSIRRKFGEEAGFGTPEFGKFFLKVFAPALRKPGFRVHVLENSKGEIVSAMTEYDAYSKRFAHLIGHDPSIESGSPGLYTVLESVRRSAEVEGVEEYDLCRNTQKTKERIMTDAHGVFQLTLGGSQVSFD